MDIRFLGHATFELSDGDAPRPDRPVPGAQQPEGAGQRRRGRPHAHPAHARARRPPRRRGRGREAHRRPLRRRSSRPPNWLGKQGVENVSDPNLGGTVEFDWGWVKLVQAFHSSTTPDGTVTYASGLVINIGGTTVYHLGDTCLFGDLQLIARAHAGRRRAHADRRPLHDGPPRRGRRRGADRRRAP